MKYSLTIDNVSSTKWGLSIQEAFLFSWIYTLPSWADKITSNEREYYFSSRFKVIEELPILTDKPDTVYRHFKKLEEKGLIFLQKFDNKDYVALTSEGKKWNCHEGFKSENNPKSGKKSEGRKKIRDTENNPAELGKKSEYSSENFPTYNNTSLITTTTIIKKDEDVFETVELEDCCEQKNDGDQDASKTFPPFVEAELQELKDSISFDRNEVLIAVEDKIEKFKEFGRQMWFSQIVIDLVCKEHAFDLPTFQSYLTTFIHEKIVEEKFARNYGSAKSHFMSWVRIRYKADKKSGISTLTHTPIDPKYRMPKI